MRSANRKVFSRVIDRYLHQLPRVACAERRGHVFAAARLVPMIGILAAVSLAGCDVFIPFQCDYHEIQHQCDTFTCSGTALSCPFSYLPPQAVLTQSDVQLPAGTPTECYLPKTFSEGENAYCKDNWIIEKIDALKGATWIQTNYADRANTSSHFLTIYPRTELDGVFIFYDDRTTVPPDWLSTQYREVTTYQDRFYVTIPDPDTAPGTKQSVKLRLWRKNDTPQPNQPLTIPGNMYFQNTPPQFPSAKVPVMYIVVLQPKKTSECSKTAALVEVKKVSYKSCGYPAECPVGLDDAATKALAAWQARFGSPDEMKFELNGPCQKEGMCLVECSRPNDPLQYQKVQTALKAPVYEARSEVRFTKPTSKATIMLPTLGQTFTSGAEGALLFDFALDSAGHLNVLDVRDMSVHVDDTWELDDIWLSLVAPLSTECIDALKPVGIPCHQYRVESGTLRVSITGHHGPDQPVAMMAFNGAPMIVTIDHSTRSFKLGGTVSGSLKVNGQDTPADVDVDITGEFYNFAPQASVTESKPISACDRQGFNAKGIELYASTSSDIDDYFGAQAQTGNLVAYEWYEDLYGATRKVWGKGKHVTIPPHTLRLGVHNFALLVRDNKGIADIAYFPVTVDDGSPPNLSPPSDAYRLVLPPERPPAKVVLGSAKAFDACTSDVRVANSAPPDAWFPAGNHVVTWRADDGHGNVATAQQNVHVWWLKAPRLADLVKVAAELEGASANQARVAAECSAQGRCDVDVKPLQTVVSQLADFLAAGPLGAERSFTQESGRLREGAMRLEAADEKFQEANAPGAKREVSLAEAVRLLDEQTALLGQVRASLQDSTR